MTRAAELHARGEMVPRARAALARLARCDLCPRNCGVDRTAGETGFCGIGRKARIASYHLHFGEEAPLVGEVGSGTIFFSHCTARCIFCQNYPISQLGTGNDWTVDRLRKRAKELGVTGYSGKRKAELIEMLRNR